MAYLTTIPIANSKLAVSQPQIQQNFLVANTNMAINHYPFTDQTANAGKHNFVEMPVRATKGTATSGEGTLYTKTETVSALSQSQLFYTMDGTTNEYQLTAVDQVNAAKFANNTNYVTPVTTFGGWSFIAGGLLFQYGIITATNALTAVKFPVAFSANAYSVNITRVNNNAGTLYCVDTITGVGFSIISSNSGDNKPYYWQAIGPQ